MDSRKILKTLTNMKLNKSDNILEVGGFSMIPLLVAGDNIKIVKQEKYKIGEIVVCVSLKKDMASLVVHRIIYIKKENKKTIYVTKGDNAIAAEYIESEYCLGKVIEITNKNGKRTKVNTPSLKDKEIVALSREVYKIYKKTGDPTIAFSCPAHIKIYDMAPDYLKNNVFSAQKEMIKRAIELIQGEKPSAPDPEFVFTKDYYALLAFHRVMNILEPYVIESSGRYGKHIKLSKAKNLMGARKRLHKAIEIAKKFEQANIKYLIYKGIASSYFIYGDPNIRECDDVDFLILPQDTQKAHEILGKLGYSYHDERGFYRPETPEEHYHTHIKPYVHETDLNTVELHTAIFTNEKYTPAVLEKRQSVEISGEKLYFLGDIEAYICQLYVTAVDDYGTANMTYEMDPNIFLQLKFRNYVDIAMMSKKYSYLPQEAIIKAAMDYDVNFHIFFALDYTCKIFGSAPFTESMRTLREKFIKNENLSEKMYNLPIDVQECLRSPFKMKMNGKALCDLRDGYFLSSGWRRVNEKIKNGEFIKTDNKNAYAFTKEGINSKVKSTTKSICAEFNIDMKDKPEEFIFVFKAMFKNKYYQPNDNAYDVRFIYVNQKEGYYQKGKTLQNSYMPMDELTEEIINYVQKRKHKPKFCLHIGKKQSIYTDSKMMALKTKYYMHKELFFIKKEGLFMAYTSILLELNKSKLKKEIIVSNNDEDILNFSFD